ncbi:MAG: GEVED domain-containing protein [Bacteroidota bacterium]
MKKIYTIKDVFFQYIISKSNSIIKIALTALIFSIPFDEVKAQTYCTPAFSFGAATFGNDFWITSTTFGTLSYTGGTALGASPYYALLANTGSVTQGLTYTLTVTRNGSAFQDNISVWIDWDHSGSPFTGTGEYVLNQTNAAGGSNTYSTSVTVPFSVTGSTRMRVMVNYFPGGSTLANTGCSPGNQSQGETKDFNITVVAGAACTGNPPTATVAPASTSVCAGTSTTLSLTGLSASGFTYQWQQSANSGGPYSNASGTSTNSTYATPTTLPFFPTYYVCQVTCSNSSLTTQSTQSSVSLNSFLNCYCTPSYAVANGGTRGIVSVGIAAPASPIILNTSTVNNVSPYYTLYTGASPISNAGLSLSSAYVLAVKVGTQANALNNAGAWIDYNQNGVFETTEFLGSFASAAASSTTNINFTVPGTASTGTTAMRIRHRYGGAVTSADACTAFAGAAGTGGAGETEDYRVSITGAACSGTPTAGNVYAGSSGTNLTASVCANATTTMYAIGYTSGVSGISLQWQSATANGGPYSNVVGGSGATSPNYTTAALTNGTLVTVHYYYKCLITCSNGGATALQTTPLDVTVNPTPSVTVNGSSAYTSSMCSGGTGVSLTAANAAAGVTTWSWLPNSTISPNNASASVTVSPAATVTYTVTATANTCSGTATAAITVNPSALTVTPSAPIITSGGNVSLTASAASSNGGITYLWNSCLTLSSATGATITASPAATTTYTVTATDAIGCSASTTVTVIVNSGTSGTINCPSYTFSYIGPAGTGTTNNWAFASTLGTVTSVATGVGMSMDDAVYPGKLIGFNFDYNGILYNTVGISTNGFIWFGTGSPATTNYTPLSSTTGQTGTVDGIISVMGGNMSGRVASSSISIVTYNSSPNRIFVIEWNNVKVSPGTSRSDYQIRLYESTNNVEFWYNTLPYPLGFETWSGEVGIRGTTTTDFLNRSTGCSDAASWSTSSSGAAGAVCSIDGGLCSTFGFWPPNGQGGFSGGAGSTFRYAPIVPTPQITASGTIDLCPGGSVNLTSTAGTSYQWYLNGGAIAGATNQTLNSVTAAGNYTVKVPSAGCTARISYITKVTNNSTVTASVSVASTPSAPLCNVTSATFTATPTNGGCLPFYQWKLNGSNVGTNSITYINNALVAGDQVQVQMTSNALCAAPVPASSTVIINGTNPALVTPSPVSNICPAATVDLSSITITDNNSTTGSYTYYSTLANANAATSVISSVITLSGTYYIRKTTASGCFGVTSIVVTITSCCVTGTWIGVVSNDWNTSGNWCGGVPTATTDVIINSGMPNDPLVDLGAVATCHNITINAGASLSIASNTLNMKGDLTIVPTGFYVHYGGTLELNGTTLQTIPDISCYNLKINNAAGVVITGDVLVSHILNLFNGIISTGGSIITVSNPSTGAVTGYSSINYVNGRLIRYINNGAFAFPIGDATHYELATVTVNNLAPTFYLLGEYFTDNTGCTDVPNVGGGPNVNGTLLTSLLNGGFWTITPDDQPTSGTYNIQLNETGYSNTPPGPSYCAVIKRDDCFANWQSLGTHINTTQSIGGGTVTAVRSGLTSFSDFGVGFSGSVLPIELLSFTATKINSNLDALLKWTTASELNNDHFEIEVATALKANNEFDFVKIGSVAGHGISQNSLEYSFVDRAPFKSGYRYYRLKQVDFNGNFSYSNTIAISFDNSEIVLKDLFPNPTDKNSNFNISVKNESVVNISFTNLLGQEVMKYRQKLKSGDNLLSVDVSHFIPGIYFLNIADGNGIIIHKKFEKY